MRDLCANRLRPIDFGRQSQGAQGRAGLGGHNAPPFPLQAARDSHAAPSISALFADNELRNLAEVLPEQGVKAAHVVAADGPIIFD